MEKFAYKKPFSCRLTLKFSCPTPTIHITVKNTRNVIALLHIHIISIRMFISSKYFEGHYKAEVLISFNTHFSKKLKKIKQHELTAIPKKKQIFAWKIMNSSPPTISVHDIFHLNEKSLPHTIKFKIQSLMYSLKGSKSFVFKFHEL